MIDNYRMSRMYVVILMQNEWSNFEALWIHTSNTMPMPILTVNDYFIRSCPRSIHYARALIYVHVVDFIIDVQFAVGQRRILLFGGVGMYAVVRSCTYCCGSWWGVFTCGCEYLLIEILLTL